ncbi:MAG: hypothetical protein KAF91_04505 [Nostoc sp. TH1S01]|nr:hypothetical protein [Nostoc sp. TH1S01]
MKHSKMRSPDCGSSHQAIALILTQLIANIKNCFKVQIPDFLKKSGILFLMAKFQPNCQSLARTTG